MCGGGEDGVAERDGDEEAEGDQPNARHKERHDLRHPVLQLIPEERDPQPVVYHQPRCPDPDPGQALSGDAAMVCVSFRQREGLQAEAQRESTLMRCLLQAQSCVEGEE